MTSLTRMKRTVNASIVAHSSRSGSGRHQALKAFHPPLRPRPLACANTEREHHAQLDQITSTYTASH